MITSRLLMSFKTQQDKKVTISIDNPRPDLMESEVQTVMSNIVTKNIFTSTSGDLVSIAGAKIVTTDTQELSV